MPGCAAVGCSNSSQKGFIMKRFPKNQERRNAWAAKMHRRNWQPTDYSVLCEIHFHPDMWEKVRVDGKRKLKYNAIPTLFALETQGVYIKPLTIDYYYAACALMNEQPSIKCDTNISSNIRCIREDTKIINRSSDKARLSVVAVSRDRSASKELSQSLQHYTKQIKALRARNKKYMNMIRRLKRNVEIFENQIKHLDEEK